MSTFIGPIQELSGVSADNFKLQNTLKSGCFFLSHCHTDHMDGLRDQPFISLLKSDPEIFLYCSSLTKLILGTYSQLLPVMNKIRELKIGLNTVIVPVCPANSMEYSMTVSCIPAGHCPGSVMFLFQTPGTCVLYTGDFRIAVGDVKKFKQLHNGGRVVNIDTVYLDTTFMNECYWQFLPRDKSIQVIIDLIRCWLNKEPDGHVRLVMPAYYGGEHIIERIATELNCRVHVLPEIHDMYLCVPEMSGIFTSSCADSRIHVENRSRNHDCLKNVGYRKILVIKPKAAPFQCQKHDKPTRLVNINGSVEVNYSSHSSFSEIVDFLKYIKPKKIYPCTDTFHLSDLEQKEVINNLLASWAYCSETEKPESLDRTPKKREAIKLVINTSSYPITDGDLNSP